MLQPQSKRPGERARAFLTRADVRDALRCLLLALIRGHLPPQSHRRRRLCFYASAGLFVQHAADCLHVVPGSAGKAAQVRLYPDQRDLGGVVHCGLLHPPGAHYPAELL